MTRVSSSRSSRRRRSNWPVRVTAQTRRNEDDLSDITSPTERLAMMWPLAVELWALIGEPLPQYDRAHTPIRIVHRDGPDGAGRQ